MTAVRQKAEQVPEARKKAPLPEGVAAATAEELAAADSEQW